MLHPGMFHRVGPTASQEQEHVELPPDGVCELRKSVSPLPKFAHTQCSVARFFSVPIDRRYRVSGWERARSLLGMIVDRAQASHATIRDVGTVFVCELVVAGGNHATIHFQATEGVC